ncbi:MAG: hypothetical protein JWO41_697 [Candidatus Saccharibacteria bacterium]|nr:hypothetical protein [Candidatus Saccharibacteria bacterium]
MIKKVRTYFSEHGDRIWPLVGITAVIGTLMLYKLGSLTGALAASEIAVTHMPLGWHGLSQDPFFLPIKFLRSLLMILFNHHGQTVVRLANTIFGVLAVLGFSRLLQLWYGGRTAFMGAALFLTSAWVLHVSRFASNDVVYLAALPIMFYVQMSLKRAELSVWMYIAPVVWGLALYVPGLIWLVAVQIWLLRKELLSGWQNLQALWKRVIVGLLGLMWLPPLLLHVFSSGSNFATWVGLPSHFPGAIELGKQFLGVPLHLFIHGPKNPELWLGKAPVMDIFTLACSLLGIYFYATHLSANRSRSLFSLFGVSWLLVALGGPVSLSLIVPLMYLFAACGIGYLLHDWLKVFPHNPFARTLGISLIAVAVAVSITYNVRAYFVAWPHNPDTISIFTHKP